MEGYSSSSSSSSSMKKEQSSFWQFSDQLRLETTNLSNLSIGDSIWSDSFVKKPEDRRNYEAPISPAAAGAGAGAGAAPDVAGWKTGFGMQQKLAFGNTNSGLLDRYNSNNYNNNNNNSGASSKNSYTNGPSGGGIKDGNYYSGYSRGVNTNYNSGEIKNYFSKAIDKPANSGHGKKSSNSNNDGKKKNSNRNSNNSSSNGGNAVADKWFKTLPPAEALPRNEAVGGYIFVCNNETMEENLKKQLFGLPSRYRDSVRAITPGLPLFLYNYSTHQLHGIYEAASFGGTNIDPMAWEDKKCPGESRFPAQVKVVTRKICGPLEEDAFRPILHHYDGPKFRLELSVPEALELLDIFVEKNA